MKKKVGNNKKPIKKHTVLTDLQRLREQEYDNLRELSNKLHGKNKVSRNQPAGCEEDS